MIGNQGHPGLSGQQGLKGPKGPKGSEGILFPGVNDLISYSYNSPNSGDYNFNLGNSKTLTSCTVDSIVTAPTSSTAIYTSAADALKTLS